PFAMPAQVFLAAFTAEPAPDGSGAEAAWPGYARTLIPASSMAPASGGTSVNALAINTPVNAGSGPVTVTHLGTFDAATGGNSLEFWPLTAPVTLAPGQRLSIAAGDFVRRAQAAVAAYSPALNFSDPRNSQYITAIAF
ncbi:MAG: hypothetical protein WCO82_11735, partial [Sphingomonadales bacterium]